MIVVCKGVRSLLDYFRHVSPVKISPFLNQFLKSVGTKSSLENLVAPDVVLKSEAVGLLH